MTRFNGGAQAPGSATPRPQRRPVPARGRGNLSGDVRTRTTVRPVPRPAPKRGKGGGGGRKGRGALNALYDPSTPLTGRGLLAAARALTKLEIAPQASGLRRQIRDTDLQGQAVQDRVGDYYRQLAGLASSAVGDQQAASDRTNAALKAITDQAQGAITSAGDAASASTQPMADRGLDGGAFARLAAETAAQRQLASQYGQVSRTSGALQGGNYEGLTATAKTIGAQRGQEALSQVANAFAKLNEAPLAKLVELRGQRGALLTKNVGALREGERNYELAMGTLGLNQQKAAADVASDRANLRLRKAEINAKNAALADARAMDVAAFIGRYGLTPQQLSAMRNPGAYLLHNAPYYTSRARRGRGGGGGSLTRHQTNDYFTEIANAKGIAQQLHRQGFGTGEIRQAMTNGYYIVKVIDPDTREQKVDRNGVPMTQRFYVPKIDGGGTGAFANAGMDLVFRGGLSSANVRALHQLGLQNLRTRYTIL